MTMLNSKLVISEELKLDPKDKARGNALKTFITERDTISEIKGREAERVQQCCCFLFTTNHIPLWIEAEDRRYWVVQADHDGHASGPRALEFAQLVGNVRAYIEFDEHLVGERYFDVANHPNITFKSTAIEMTSDATAKITGDLTIKGITKPVVLDATLNKAAMHPMLKKTNMVG